VKRVVYFVGVVVISGGLFYASIPLWTGINGVFSFQPEITEPSIARGSGNGAIPDEYDARATSRIIWARALANPANPAFNPLAFEETSGIGVGFARGGPWFLFAIVLLALLISLGTNVMLFRWRRRGGFEGVSDDLAGIVRKNDHNVQAFEGLIRGLGDQASKRSQELLQSFLQLQGSLDDRDREIERYKDGFDTKILLRIARKLTNLDKEFGFSIDDLGKDGRDDDKGLKALTELREEFRELLEIDMGVTEFRPEEGQDVRGCHGVSNKWVTRGTDDPKANHTIAKVVAPGWQAERGEGNPVTLQEARVEVFVFTEPGQDQTDENLSEVVGPRRRESEENESEAGGKVVTVVIGAVILVLLAFGFIGGYLLER
jgi:hypothetical protein